MISAERPDPILVDRAVQLFVDACRTPKHDNGDTSLNGFMVSALASLAPNNATDELLLAFAAELRKRLLTPNESGYYRDELKVDYHPGAVVGDAADAVGLEMAFPIKTSIVIFGGCVRSQIGSSGPYQWHYQIDDGRWLVSSLQGDADDIDTIKQLVRDGILDENARRVT